MLSDVRRGRDSPEELRTPEASSISVLCAESLLIDFPVPVRDLMVLAEYNFLLPGKSHDRA